MGKKITGILFFVLCAFNSRAQLNIQPVQANSANATRMAQQIMGPGFTISNAQLIGNDNAAGTFNGTSSMPLDSGILLTTGFAINALGPNNQNQVSFAWGSAGDADLANMIGAPVTQLHDACALQFDVQVPGSGITFNYVFGSDEYPEFVCSTFNDAFAIFISGPGISGLKNIAVVPVTNLPVNISSINDGSPGSFSGGGTCNGANQSLAHSQYYVNNGDGTQSPYNTSPFYIQYDGFTTRLNAAINNLIQGQTYHLKLAISDVTDGVIDSGLFIEASTCPTSYLVAKLGKPYTTDTLSPIAVGGCSTGIIPVKLLTPDTGVTILHLGLSGTALNGVDYTTIADTVIFNPGDTLYNLSINPISSGNTIKTVIVNLLTTCGAYSADTLYLIDTFNVQLSPHDTTICTGASVQLQATGATGFTWYPSTGLSDTTIGNPVAAPTADMTYYCVATTGACSAIDSLHITLTQTAPFNLTLTPHDTTVCPNSIVQLQANGGGNNFAWTPNIRLTDSSIANPRANPLVATTYTCVSTAGTCSLSDSLTIHVFPAAVASIIQSGDTLISGGGVSYQWYINSQILAGATDSFLVIAQSGYYMVQIINQNGCSASSTNNYFVYTPTGIQSINNESTTLIIYPNPAKNEFTVTSTGGIKNGKLEIYNVLGQCIYTIEIKNQPAGFSKTIRLNVAGGVYLVALTYGAKTYMQRLVIE